jgi:hypothetical protein
MTRSRLPFLDAAGIRLAAMESTDRPQGPLVSGAILAEWAEWADSTRFETSRRLREGYATAEVDAFREELRDTFLGVRQPPLTWDEARATGARHCGGGTHVGAPSMGNSGGGGPPCRVGRVGRVDDIFHPAV